MGRDVVGQRLHFWGCVVKVGLVEKKVGARLEGGELS